MKKRIFSIILVLCMLTSLAPMAFADNEIRIPAGVNFSQDADGHFLDGVDCTRGNLAYLIWLDAGSPKPSYYNPYSDIDEKYEHIDAVLWCSENNIIVGYADATFRPEVRFTLQQLIIFIWRYNGSPKPSSYDTPFVDVVPNTAYSASIAWAYENGLIAPDKDGRLNGTNICPACHVHDYYEVSSKPATCFEDGYIKYRCNCGAEYTAILPASHMYNAETLTCIFCGAKINNPFTDIGSLSTEFRCGVLWAYLNGITSGTTATTFEPNKPCTRAEVVTFLWRLCGSPEPETAKNPFTDVSESSVFYKAILWAYENGITMGTTETTFAPKATVTRAQFVTFLWRLCGEETIDADNNFSDVSDSSVYANAIIWASSCGIVNGYGNGTFCPNTPCTRAHVAVFLYRTFQ